MNHDETPPTSIQFNHFILFRWLPGQADNNAQQPHDFVIVISFSDRLFKIRLRRSADVFADDVVLETSKGSIAFDMDKVYQGELEGIF